MAGLMSQFPFVMIDWAWILEFATLTFSWIVLGYGVCPDKKPLIVKVLDFLLLFVVLNAVTLLSAYFTRLIGADAAFPLVRVAVQGWMTYGFMIHFRRGRRQTKIVLWLTMTMASLSFSP